LKKGLISAIIKYDIFSDYRFSGSLGFD